MTARPEAGDRPNILIVSCDELRYPDFAYGPEAGMKQPIKDILGFRPGVDGASPFAHFFPAFLALRKHAVVFRNHTIATSACVPSRTALYTGQYGARTGVKQTNGLFKQAEDRAFRWLDPAGIPTLGDWFRAAGYSTHYFGKWHVSESYQGSLLPWGFADWELSDPEPHGSNASDLGVYRDVEFADVAVDFLDAQVQATSGQPWLAVASFVNPHDLAAAYPQPWAAAVQGNSRLEAPLRIPRTGAVSLPAGGETEDRPGGLPLNAREAGLRVPLNRDGFPQDNFELPPTWNEDLRAAGKPDCQFESTYKIGLALTAQRWQEPDALPSGSVKNFFFDHSPLPFQLSGRPEEWFRAYGQFYTYLHYLVDQQMRRVLDRLYASGLWENTIVVFFSDHGDMGSCHGGMIEKWHNAYREAIHVPLVVSGPRVNERAEEMREIHQLTSHVDLAPTLLGLAGFDAEGREELRHGIQGHRPLALPGADLSDLVRDPEPAGKPVIESWGEERRAVLFVTDDTITTTYGSREDLKSYEVFTHTVDEVREGTWKESRPPVPLEPGPIADPSHVQAVRDDRWKLVRYWTDPIRIDDPEAGDWRRPLPELPREGDQWELYSLPLDATEAINLVSWNDAGEAIVEASRVAELNARLEAAGRDERLTVDEVEGELERLRGVLLDYLVRMGVCLDAGKI